MKLRISHRTEYQFDQPVEYALQQWRLTPKSRPEQAVLNWQSSIDGGDEQLGFEDHHNNRVQLISINPGTVNLTITVSGEVETSDTSGVIGRHGGFAPLWLFTRRTPLTTPGPGIRQLSKRVEIGNALNSLHALSAEIISAVTYEKHTTDAATTAEQAMQQGAGVCQDHAHIFISAAREAGLPARYVSGYLLMPGVEEQTASHAWAEVHIDDLGWVGFDVSNGMSPDDKYVRIATGLDYRDAAPVSGIRYGNHGESMLVSLQVQQQ